LLGLDRLGRADPEGRGGPVTQQEIAMVDEKVTYSAEESLPMTSRRKRWHYATRFGL